MSARIDICNVALVSMLGANSINSLDDDSDEARAMKFCYYIARDAVLEDANWTFATKRFQPAENADPPEFGWTYSYTIPSDIMRVTNVLREAFTVGFFYDTRMPEEYKSAHVVEGNEILSNDNPIYCLGIRTMEDEGNYSPLFEEAFAGKLASLCALTLTAKESKRDFALGLYLDTIKKAKTRDGMQNTTRRMRNNTLRFGR